MEEEKHAGLRISNNKAGGYISEIKFNNSQIVSLNSNDIVVFVGPNNVGKSQSLKDIYELSASAIKGTVISSVKFIKSPSSIIALLKKLSSKHIIDHGDYFSCSVMGHDYAVYDYTENNFYSCENFKEFRHIFVANLDTISRLSICAPAESVQINEGWRHPIHYTAFNPDYRRWLTDSFKKAFGNDITPFLLNGRTIPLCIGSLVNLDNKGFQDEQTRQEEHAKILLGYPQVQNQGDGIKSFTGILLYLMLDYYCIYLIDEPEAFLHPPQARIMGQIIGNTLTDEQQAFISTHSEEVIKGLLEVAADRVKIIRINRDGDANSFAVLNSNNITNIWSDPLLKYSNILSGLFHKNVVLCESDSDCKLYSVIERHLKIALGKYSETLFIHCGGKHRMAKVAKALRALNVCVKLIPDIDILDNPSVFEEVTSVFGIEWTEIKRDYEIIVSNLHSTKERIKRIDAKNQIISILDAAGHEFLSKSELNKLHETIATESKWKSLKKSGIAGIPSGQPTAAFNRLNKILQKHDVFMVPEGEIENFVKDVGGHGNEWVNNVLVAHPDLDDPAYDQLKAFIREIGLIE